jgi:hypothetical protein
LNSGEQMSSYTSGWLLSSASGSGPRIDRILAKLVRRKREMSLGDRECGLGFRDLSEFGAMFRLRRLPENGALQIS